MPSHTLFYYLDIRKEACPVTFVRCKLLIEEMNSGDSAEILYAASEAARLPKALTNLECSFTAPQKHADYYKLIVTKH